MELIEPTTKLAYKRELINLLANSDKLTHLWLTFVIANRITANYNWPHIAYMGDSTNRLNFADKLTPLSYPTFIEFSDIFWLFLDLLSKISLIR